MTSKNVFDRPGFSRRTFLQGSAVGAGAIALSPYLSKLAAYAAPPVADNQGILVTIMLAGGNDGLNTLIPVSNPAYATLRPNLRITNGLSIGNGFALHPSLVRTKARFDAGKVAIVRGVGYSPADLSHFESTDIWTQGWGGSGTRTTGWAGRFLDTLPNTATESLYGVSLHGNVGPHLDGATAQASSLPLSINDAFGVDRDDPSDARMFDAVANYGVGSSGLGPMGDLVCETERDLMLLTQRIRPAYGFTQQDSNLSQQLVLAARLINANLGIRVIDTEIGGFDTHANQTDWHATLLSRVDTAIDRFFTALAPRWRGQVTVMTFSEFGRRPEENDGGSDHGTSAPLFVIGDHVNGGLHGTQPSLTSLDNHGNLATHVDFRAVYASVLNTWLKVDHRDILGKSYTTLPLFTSGPSAPPGGGVSPTGYWVAGPNGAVRAYGNATKFSSLARVALPIVGGASTPTHKGMWLVASDGGIFSFGDAKFYGSTGAMRLNKPIVGMAPTKEGRGYWLVASDGGIFAFGDARFRGSTGAIRLNKPIVGMAATATGKGYWLVASDGGIFAFGDAQYKGSAGNVHLAKPIVGMCASPTGNGYWMVTADGKVYAYGDAKYHGGGMPTSAPVVSIARSNSGKGYWLAARDGTVKAFGDAPVLGSPKIGTATLVRT